VFKLAHLSDIHLSPLPQPGGRDLLNKRLFGYVNWHRGRKLVHRREILDSLTRDLIGRHPDHIAVTGDLVNLGLPEEFVRAAAWLRRLGTPDRVTAIPGNHDAYVRLHPERGTAHWRDYMESNPAGEALLPASPHGFPFVRRLGDIALIALSSAVPTLPFIAAGRIGEAQRRALAGALAACRREALFRVVLIHHPPLPGQASWQRSLRDAGALAETLTEHGAELVLHGHNHQQSLRRLDTATGPAFVIGVPSASEGRDNDRTPAAAYNEYGIERVKNGWYCEMVTRTPSGSPDCIWQSSTQTLRER
jgi:3',5'-cyclic AMP phosphodiesterase CpdA